MTTVERWCPHPMRNLILSSVNIFCKLWLMGTFSNIKMFQVDVQSQQFSCIISQCLDTKTTEEN